MSTTGDNDILRAIRSRRTVREFSPEPVPDDMVRKLIEAASWAPSNQNRQPWLFLVVRDRARIARMVDAVEARARELASSEALADWQDRVEEYLRFFTVFARAPLVIVPLYRRTGEAILERLGIEQEIDADLCATAAAIENLLLAAHSLGLGGCWMTAPLLAVRDLEQILDVPRPYRIVAVVALGAPAGPPPEPPGRKALERILEYR